MIAHLTRWCRAKMGFVIAANLMTERLSSPRFKSQLRYARIFRQLNEEEIVLPVNLMI
jgi:hypothetical protein